MVQERSANHEAIELGNVVPALALSTRTIGAHLQLGGTERADVVRVDAGFSDTSPLSA